tara:strand:- start:33471 stop:36119 length:2649 start_codon:yes stop_codon:yes gene_type:complete
MTLLLLTLLFSFNLQAQTPFDNGLIDLTSSVGDIVSITNPMAGESLRVQAIELSTFVDQQRCSSFIGIQVEDAGATRVELAAYEIPGAPYNDQMLALINQYPQFASMQPHIYPFRNLLGAYARSLGVNHFKDKSSTELATGLSAFAASEYQLYLPKGLLLVEVIQDRLIDDPSKLTFAMNGVSSLSLNERAEVLHHLSARIASDAGAGSSDFDRQKRVAEYFTNAGLTEGLLIRERHQGQEKISVIAKDTASGQFLKNTYMPVARSVLGQAQEFYSLSGQVVEAREIPEEFRPIVSTQLLSGRNPSVWSEYQERQQEPGPSRLTVQAPTVSVVPESEATPNTGVAPIVIRGLDENEQPANLQVQGDAGVTFTTGTVDRVVTFSPNQIRNIDTDITQIIVPNFMNPQETARQNQVNQLGLSNLNAPRGQIFQTSLATVSATDGAVLRATGSRSDGTNVQGFSNLMQVDRNGNTMDSSGFIQNGNDFGVSGRYQTSAAGTLLEGRSFFNLDTTDRNSDGEVISRGVNFTGVMNYRSQTHNGENTTVLNGTVGADIPVGENDTVRTVASLDADQGVTNIATSYNTDISEGTRLSVIGQTGVSGESIAARVQNENTIATARTSVDAQGNQTNAVALGQNLQSVLPENTEGFVMVGIEEGDLGTTTRQVATFAVSPGVILSEDGRVGYTISNSDRTNATGAMIQEQSTQTFVVTDSIGTVNWDVNYSLGETTTPIETTDRVSITNRVTYGVDRNGRPLDSNGGVVGSLTSGYTQEMTSSNETQTNPGTRVAEQFRIDATTGYTSGTNSAGRSYGVNGGLEFTRNIVSVGGTVESTEDNRNFRIGAEFNEQYQRGSATCNAGRRRTINAAGVEDNSPVECHVTFVRRF